MPEKAKEDSTMKFHLDERLIEHMKKSNHKNILITPMMCHTWGGSRLDISARFVDSEETAVLKREHFLSFPHEFGEILIRRIPQRVEETVTLGLSRFFRQITVQGIYSAWQ